MIPKIIHITWKRQDLRAKESPLTLVGGGIGS